MTDRPLKGRIDDHKNSNNPSISRMIPHQKKCKKKRFTETVLQNGLPHQDIWAKEELWIHLLSPDINKNYSELNLENLHKIEMWIE